MCTFNTPDMPDYPMVWSKRDFHTKNSQFQSNLPLKLVKTAHFSHLASNPYAKLTSFDSKNSQFTRFNTR